MGRYGVQYVDKIEEIDVPVQPDWIVENGYAYRMVPYGSSMEKKVRVGPINPDGTVTLKTVRKVRVSPSNRERDRH